jgi:hypothetical protein
LGADRGSDVLPDLVADVANSLDIIYSNFPAYRPDMKPVAERKFGQVKDDVVRWLPGFVHKRLPGERRHYYDARFTLWSLTKLLIKYGLWHNRHHRVSKLPPGYVRQSEINPTHLELWRWGVEHIGGPQQREDAIVRPYLLEPATFKATKHGLLFRKDGIELYYRRIDVSRREAERAHARFPQRRWKSFSGTFASSFRGTPYDTSTEALTRLCRRQRGAPVDTPQLNSIA